MALVTLRLAIEQSAPPDVGKRLLNRVVKEGLEKAAELWIKEFLPLHFAQGATQRYQYQLVSRVYAIIKNRAKRVRPWIGKTRGDWVTAPKPVRPWVWSGQAMNQLLSKHPSEFNIKATATTTRQQVKVPLPVPHPVTTDHAGELGRLRDDEFKAMHQVAFDYIMDSLKSGMNMKRRTRLAWRIEADRIIETRTEQAV